MFYSKKSQEYSVCVAEKGISQIIIIVFKYFKGLFMWKGNYTWKKQNIVGTAKALMS